MNIYSNKYFYRNIDGKIHIYRDLICVKILGEIESTEFLKQIEGLNQYEEFKFMENICKNIIEYKDI